MAEKVRFYNIFNIMARCRPSLAQGKIHLHKPAKFGVGPLADQFIKFPMIQEPFPTPIKTRRRQPAAKRRRLIGGREILLVLIALSLLALAPSIAQVSGFGQNNAASTPALPLGAAERPESNFAGSAFYFLEPEYAIPANIEAFAPGNGSNAGLIAPADGGSVGSDPDARVAGISAQPLVIRPGNPDYARAIKCLTDAIYYEAANEPDSGQRAVAQVIINRVRHPAYPNNICGVIYQGSERRTGCQFSYSCDGSMARAPSRVLWARAYRVAAAALAGYVHSAVGTATHYHTVNIYPYWAPSLDYLGVIGAHRFYKWKGSAGRPSAFFIRYAGNEPFPGPKPRVWDAPQTPLLDPIQLQQQYEREYAAIRLKAEQEARATLTSALTPAQPYSAIAPSRLRPPPVYAAPDYSKQARIKGGDDNFAGSRLPENTNIKPEYQNSGSWKSQPTG